MLYKNIKPKSERCTSCIEELQQWTVREKIKKQCIFLNMKAFRHFQVDIQNKSTHLKMSIIWDIESPLKPRRLNYSKGNGSSLNQRTPTGWNLKLERPVALQDHGSHCCSVFQDKNNKRGNITTTPPSSIGLCNWMCDPPLVEYITWQCMCFCCSNPILTHWGQSTCCIYLSNRFKRSLYCSLTAIPATAKCTTKMDVP